MEISRLPLTYVQEHVPFLTKRNIIFFGRFELDAAHYSTGALNDDNGLNIRRGRRSSVSGHPSLAGTKISSIGNPKTAAILKANERPGSYFPRSMALTVWRETSSL
jgi:hypothetical protein